MRRQTRGTETSKYPEEEKTNAIPSSSERNGISPNQEACLFGFVGHSVRSYKRTQVDEVLEAHRR